MAFRPGTRIDAPAFEADALAPWAQVDRYPIIIGSSLTFLYLGAAQRQARFGYRLQWVDLLTELIQRDSSAFSNIEARILVTAGGRVNVISAAAQFSDSDADAEKKALVIKVREMAGLPAELPNLTEDERILADQIAAHVQRQVNAIQRKPQILASQLWGIYYGVSANELMWDRTPLEWRIRGLNYIHPRRIAFPDQNNWHPHIWDQGLVVTSGPEWREYLTSGMFGIDVCDYPTKFLVHSPELLSGYPTADGLGFIIGWWIAMKIMGVRSYSQFVERFGKPGTLAYYNTGGTLGKPRDASDEDKAIAQAFIQAVGYGGAPGGVLPDSIKMELFGPAAMKGSAGSADPKTFSEYCDDQIARAVRTTSGLQGGQKYGSRSALETMMVDANRVANYDAAGLSATWTRDIALPIATLNYATYARLAPTVFIQVDNEPGPEVMLERIKDAVSLGMPIDADKAAGAIGMKNLLVAKGDRYARVLYLVKPVEPMLPTAEVVKEQDSEDPKKQVAPDEGADEEAIQS